MFLLLTAFTVHLPAVLGGDQNAMSQVLKDVALAGGALVLSGVFSSAPSPEAESGPRRRRRRRLRVAEARRRGTPYSDRSAVDGSTPAA